jgi:hypothetical protein
MRNRSYMGTTFEVWNDERTWFWLVPNPYRDGGAIGTAASEADAIEEARELIESDVVGWPGALERLANYIDHRTIAA